MAGPGTVTVVVADLPEVRAYIEALERAVLKMHRGWGRGMNLNCGWCGSDIDWSSHAPDCIIPAMRTKYAEAP